MPSKEEVDKSIVEQILEQMLVELQGHAEFDVATIGNLKNLCSENKMHVDSEIKHIITPDLELKP